MAEYLNLSVKECAKRLSELSDVLVLMHKNPDGDAVSSASALALIFKGLGARAKILCADKIPERLKFITDSLGVEIADDDYNYKYAVSVDVASPMQLGSLREKVENITLMIDHHAVGERFADGYVDPWASSAAEVLADISDELISIGKLEMTESLAFALFVGISSDTGCFAYSNATAKTHRRAAHLMEYGIDAADINHRLFNSKSEGQIKAEGYVASKMRTSADGKIGYAAISKEERERMGLKIYDFETAIDVIRSQRGVIIAIIVKETDEGSMRASLRSVGHDVASIAKSFGGGGHIRAAGCTVNAESVDSAINMLLEKTLKII